jgi:hypothetical protein
MATVKKKKPDFSTMLGNQLRAAKASLGAGGLDELAVPSQKKEDTDPPPIQSTTSGTCHTPHEVILQATQEEPNHRKRLKYAELDTRIQQSDPTVGSDTRYVGIDTRIQQLNSRIQHTDPTVQQLDPTHQPNTRNRHTDPTHKPNTQEINSIPINKLTNTFVVRTEAQKKVYEYLAKNGQHITSHALIHAETGIKLGTLRDILRKFENEGMITKKKWVGEGGQQGLLITPTNLQHTNPTVGSNTQIRQLDPTHEIPLLDRKKESIYLSNQKAHETSPLVDLTAEEIGFYWPHLAAIDFGPSQIRQIFERLQKQGRTIDETLTDSVRQGLTHADAALEITGGQLMDNKGNFVVDLRAYVFRALARDGYYAAPKGYVSPEAQRLKDAAEQARIEAEAKKALVLQQEAQKKVEQGAVYEEWRNSLSEENLEKIRNNAPAHARTGLSFEKWLKLYYFPETVKK